MSNMFELYEAQKLILRDMWLVPERKRGLYIGRRRLGKTRVACFLLNLSLYYASGLLTKHYPEMRTPKMDALMCRWLELGKDFNVAFFTPGENQGKKAVATEMPASIKMIYHYYPELAKHPLKHTPSLNKVELAHPTLPNVMLRVSYQGFDAQTHKARGGGYEIIILDEIQDYKFEELKKVVYPQTRAVKGFIFSFGTANPRPELKEHKASFAKTGSLTIITVKDSVAMGDMSQEDLQELIDEDFDGNWEDKTFLQEWMCVDDLPSEGAVLEHWRRGQVSDTVRKSVVKPVRVVSIDIGYTDAYVIQLWDYYDDRNFELIKAVKFTGKTTEEIIDILEADEDFDNVDIFIYPHDAKAKRTTSKNTDLDLWKKAKFAKKYVPAKKYRDKPTHMRVLQTVMNRAKVEDKDLSTFTTDIIEDLNSWSFDPDKADTPLHDKYSHTGDAFLYGVTTMAARSFASNVEEYTVKTVMQQMLDDANNVGQ